MLTTSFAVHGLQTGFSGPAGDSVLFAVATPAVAWETAREIRDDALRLMFVCCHPAIAPDAQVILALKVLGDFGTREIARAFLSSEAAIEKQLTRTKQRIAAAGLGFELPEGQQLSARLDGVLGVLYLLFNEGYKASTDWVNILRHYDALRRLNPSPLVGLNRAVAVAAVHGPQAGLEALAGIPRREPLASHYLLPAVTGEFHWRLHQHEAAAECFRSARRLVRVGPEEKHRRRMLARSRANTVA